GKSGGNFRHAGHVSRPTRIADGKPGRVSPAGPEVREPARRQRNWRPFAHLATGDLPWRGCPEADAPDVPAPEVANIGRIEELSPVHRHGHRFDLAIARGQELRLAARGRYRVQVAPAIGFPDKRNLAAGRPEELVAVLTRAVVLVELVVHRS